MSLRVRAFAWPVCDHTGMLETSTMKEVFDVKGKASGMTWEQFTGDLASTTTNDE